MGFMARLLKTEVGNAVKGGKISAVSRVLFWTYDTKVCFLLFLVVEYLISNKKIKLHKFHVADNSCLLINLII